MSSNIRVCGVTANSEPAGGDGGSGGNGNGWRQGTSSIVVDGVFFTPAEYKIYCLLQEIKAEVQGE